MKGTTGLIQRGLRARTILRLGGCALVPIWKPPVPSN
jgi:hypothetical protein